MKRQTLYAGTGFFVVLAYLGLGFIVQCLFGKMQWDAVPAALTISVVVAAAIAAATFAVIEWLGKGAAAPVPGAPYKPSKSILVTLASAIVIAAGAGAWLSTSRVIDERAAIAAAREAASTRRAAIAAMTPEERAAAAAQQNARAEAAAAAASAQAGALAKKKAADEAANNRVRVAAMGAVTLKQAMKDPEAFELRSALVMPSGATCYEYRGKNSFGAVLPSHAVLTAKGRLLTQEGNGNTFVGAWNKECTASGGQESSELFRRLGLV